MKVRLIGYWIRSVDDADFIPPQELVRPVDPDVRRKLAAYLDAGALFEQYRGVSHCRFFCEGYNGSRELTDGEWVWPEGLSHYVSVHGVTLPQEFVARALSGRPIPRGDLRDDGRREVDVEWWKQWCRQHRSGKCAAQLREAAARGAHDALRSILGG